MKKLLIIISILFIFIISSCMSMQKDIEVTDTNLQDNGFAIEMQSRLAPVDASFFLKSQNASSSNACMYVIKQIQKKLTEPELAKPLAARLFALEGRAYLLIDDKTKAQKCYEDACKKYSSDSEVVVLGNRLGKFENLSEIISRSGANGILILEGALTLYSQRKYEEAAASFDTAFLSLAPFYKNAYKELRDESWKLKSVSSESSSNTDSLIMLKKMTVSQMISVASKFSTALDYCTAGEKFSDAKLFDIVSKAGLLESRSNSGVNTSSQKIQSSTEATKIICARFLWNLYNAHSTDSGAATVYSRTFRSKSNSSSGEVSSSLSPVSDVSVESEDFDAVLGCVEHELMSLPDGKSFTPAAAVSAVEFAASVKKIK